nr:aminotransferase class V-fold PLP-dependent enzyme [FCB group bacterium]
MKKIYFDHSATTPVDNTVAEKMLEVMTGKFGNPSSVHSTGKEANHLLDESRHVFADMLKCDASEICFTSGGTEADNLALMGTVEPGQHLITTAIEHHAIL